MTLFVQTVEQTRLALAPLNLRERLLLLIAIGGVILIFWYSQIYEALKNHQISIKQTLQLQTKTLSRLEALLKMVKEREYQDPNSQIYGEIQSLEEKNRRLERRFAEKGIFLVEPESQHLIQQILLDQKGALIFSGLERPEAKPYPEEGLQQPDSAIKGEKTVQLYRQPLIIRWLGSYPETWRTLKKLESTTPPLLWESLHYRSTNPPMGHITLTISTSNFK
jgi:hypothetical protein